MNSQSYDRTSPDVGLATLLASTIPKERVLALGEYVRNGAALFRSVVENLYRESPCLPELAPEEQECCELFIYGFVSRPPDAWNEESTTLAALTSCLCIRLYVSDHETDQTDNMRICLPVIYLTTVSLGSHYPLYGLRFMNWCAGLCSEVDRSRIDVIRVFYHWYLIRGYCDAIDSMCPNSLDSSSAESLLDNSGAAVDNIVRNLWSKSWMRCFDNVESCASLITRFKSLCNR